MSADSSTTTKSRAAFEAAMSELVAAAHVASTTPRVHGDHNLDYERWRRDTTERLAAARARLMALYDQAAQAPAAAADGTIEGEIYMIDGQGADCPTALIGIEVDKHAYHATADALRTTGSRVRVQRLPEEAK